MSPARKTNQTIRKADRALDFTCLQLEGSLFVADMLQEIAVGRGDYQTAADYHIPKGIQLHEEYGRAFKIARAQFSATRTEIHKSRLDRPRTAALTLAHIRDFLGQCLGYGELTPATEPITLNDHRYPISFIACNGTIPIIVAPWYHDLTSPHEEFAITDLDGKTGGSRRKSPVQLMQLFLNASETCTWGLVTNGRVLRLLRDSATLTRPCYLEFDLQTMLTDDLYHEFRALWHIAHASRGVIPADSDGKCIWERWRDSGHEQGTRVREGLRFGVTTALRALGEGFLNHPGNQTLIDRLDSGALTPHAYYQQLLRMIYRLIFIFTAEERGILHPHDESPEATAARQLYDQGYALKRLTMRTLRRQGFDNFDDLWICLQIVMRGLRDGEPRLALPPLGGLFDATQCPDLDDAHIPNRALLAAIRAMRWASVGGSLTRVDYRTMGPEELGSVYESLLELVPDVNANLRIFRFFGDDDDGDASTAGNDRKTTGSYYTPDCLVQELIKSALDPVIEARLSESEDPEKALLEITVIDPASGSGHFLLAAARRLAENLASLRAPDGAATDSDYRTALRDVVSHCIYGVDRNPMAVELARTALWLEGFEPGRPLSFLDHHLICGDALLGIMDLKQLLHGIPKEAYKALSGDDKELCSKLSKENATQVKALVKDLKGHQELFHQEEREDLSKRLAALDVLPDDTPDEIAAKTAAHRDFLDAARDSHPAHAADLYIGCFLLPKDSIENAALVPTTDALRHELTGSGPAAPPEMLASIDAACRKARVLHWPLAFAHVFARGGFDCVLGNPPWDMLQLDPQEFFATRAPVVAQAKHMAARSKLIAELAETAPYLHQEYMDELRRIEALQQFVHVSDRFEKSGRGRINLASLFTETFTLLKSSRGFGGLVSPSGIATDSFTQVLWRHIADNHLVSLFDIENREAIFANVHRSYKFCLLTLGHVDAAEFAFFLSRTNQLADTNRCFALSPDDFVRINPNTRTCPIFRSRMDAELTRRIYRNVPILIRESRDDSPEENPWGIRFQLMFMMNTDSGLFLDAADGEGGLPLYEAKMIHQFDHRWATYEYKDGSETATDVSLTDKQDPNYTVRPRYYVAERHVLARIANVPTAFAKAYAAEDDATLLLALANWVDATECLSAGDPVSYESQGTLFSMGTEQLGLFGSSKRTPITKRYPIFADLPNDWRDKKTQKSATLCPLTDTERKQIATLSPTSDIGPLTSGLMDSRSPRWLMGWRDITNATNERTVIASVMPRVGVGNNLPLMYLGAMNDSVRAAALLGNLCALVLDFVARHKVGGTHLNFFIYRQLPVLPPDRYTESDLAYIVPRVLELTYTTHDMRPWAEAIWEERGKWNEGSEAEELPPPYPFDEDRRAQLRAELDAYYARLYGLTRDDLRYILAPADIMGPDYPSETFRGLKNKEQKLYKEYRTQRLVLAAWDEQ